MEFIEILKTILFGILEGITEWLPISSTGHLILLREFVNLNVSKEFWDMFLYIIQLGAIMAVVVLYFKKLNPFALKKEKEEKKDTWKLWFKVLVGCIPAGIVGVLLDNYMDQIETPIVVAISLIVFGFVFIIVEQCKKGKTFKINDLKELTYKTALMIGLFQILSIIPGTSRSGITIIGAMIVGTNRKVAAEYTFFLAIPVMIGASLLKIVKFNWALVTTSEILVLVVGTIAAFIVSILVIKFLINYIKKHDFQIFGWYRIVLGLIIIGYFLLFS